jgi:hypothetical protein
MRSIRTMQTTTVETRDSINDDGLFRDYNARINAL